MAKPTRLFFVADLHGSALCFRKFLNAGPAYKADVLLIGGDIAAKTITPIYPERGGWVATVGGERRWVATETDLRRIETELKDRGSLPFRTEHAAWQELQADRRRGDALFLTLALEQLGEWLRLAQERLAGKPIRALVGLGNDDFDEMEGPIAASAAVELTDTAILRVDDHHELLTLPYSNPTPWRTKRELPEEEIARRIDAAAARLEEPARAIFNLHVPPSATHLDLAPRLDANLETVLSPGGEPEMVHVGSPAVRDAIARHQPLLGLHGHIHESKGFAQIGRTLCLNPGSAYGEGSLQGAVVDLDRDRIRSYLLTSG
jgi:Icc-related predicted phosphoesterase